MKHIDYGLSVFNKSVFDSVGSSSSFDLGDLLENLSVNEDLFGCEILERYYEIGSLQGIKSLENYLVKNEQI
jgi:NDP-sugar pyrophosphorylase family protein